jgi:NAD(P)-dependent dehydrogenase (short-subunit alcohol dehydrogenase family)
MKDFRESLEGRVAIVTGAGQGIGRGIAKLFAAFGAFPVIAELNAENGRAVAEDIGPGALFTHTDAADPASLNAMRDAVLVRFGRIDFLINNGGIFTTLKTGPFWEIEDAEWTRVMHVNANGPFLASRAVFPVMRTAGFGRIVNMSSSMVTLGRGGALHYAASKSALIGMTRSMAREAGPFGVTVNAILPGTTFTEIERAVITPDYVKAVVSAQCLDRMGAPDDIAGAVLFLCSDAGRWVTGQCLTVDAGRTHT